jgi:hypothetical protein
LLDRNQPTWNASLLVSIHARFYKRAFDGTLVASQGLRFCVFPSPHRRSQSFVFEFCQKARRKSFCWREILLLQIVEFSLILVFFNLIGEIFSGERCVAWL